MGNLANYWSPKQMQSLWTVKASCFSQMTTEHLEYDVLATSQHHHSLGP